MAKSDDNMLELAIRNFLAVYTPSFHSLIAALDEARISHYSSGGGNKGITFEIFPASDFVKEMMRMISLDRAQKKSIAGLKDAITKGGANPAIDFLLYLKRWSGFAEQVMQREGASAHGVAAARAKLIMDDLGARLGEGRQNGAIKNSEFVRLMEAIGLTLLARIQKENEHVKLLTRQANEYNYRKALAVAQGNYEGEWPQQQSEAA